MFFSFSFFSFPLPRRILPHFPAPPVPTPTSAKQSQRMILRRLSSRMYVFPKTCNNVLIYQCYSYFLMFGNLIWGGRAGTHTVCS